MWLLPVLRRRAFTHGKHGVATQLAICAQWRVGGVVVAHPLDGETHKGVACLSGHSFCLPLQSIMT